MSTKKPEWQSTSAEAHRLVFGARNAQYDHPAIDYGRTAELYAALTGIEMSTREAICFMVCVKLSRLSAALQHDFTADMVRDTIVDLAGYGDCLFGVWEMDQDLNFDEMLERLEQEDD